MLNEGSIKESEPISLIGYSHGGNVSIHAARMLNHIYGIKVNLITVSTPAYNSANPYLKGPEDPENNPRIIEHYQLVQKHDIVTKIAGGSRTYSNSITKNFIFTDEDVPIDGYFRNISAHTEFPGSDYLGKTNKIKTIPSMSPAPIPLKLNEEIKPKK